MGLSSPFKEQQSHSSIPKKVLPWALYSLLPLALLHFYFHHLPSLQSQTTLHLQNTSIIITSIPNKVEDVNSDCDYNNGKWVSDKLGPLYNGSTCGTIKDGQNCMNHGRPDMGYLYWSWEPKNCKLPRFDPNTFLKIFQNKHLAFIGDSMARNQLESLLCLISTISTPKLVYTNGNDNKFRKWHFDSYNINVSIYWSPFLVKGIEKSSTGFNHNKLYLDSVDNRWGSEVDKFDMVVLSVGHWFLHPAVFYEKDSVFGCHFCQGLNHSEVGFFDVLRKAINTSLNAIIDKRSANQNGVLNIVVTTFSPSHFEGEWDKAGACARKKPLEEGEKVLEGMNADMRQIEVEEVEKAKEKVKGLGKIRVEALDVTKLAFMRPDGHPGPYMYPFPFGDGYKEHVQNDCVHWCLPGPIDTWNEILLKMMKKWEVDSSRRGSGV